MNQTFVKRFFPNQDPIGKHFGIDLPKYSGSWEIVGVFADFKINNPREEIRPVYLRPLAQKFTGYTEPDMNRLLDGTTIKEKELPAKFGTDEHQLLLVAEKYQTGFDQPLLHTMYVDKVLTGLAAVQTLSRLNRIHDEKSDTFVLDFRNDADEIADAFAPYYGRTVAPPSDPNVLFDTRRRLNDFDVLRDEEVAAAVAELLTVKSAKSHARVHALLDPAVERFAALSEEDRLACKDALNRFVRIYSFLSQIVGFGDVSLERDYTYCRALASLLRDCATAERLDLGEEVELTHLRNERTFEGAMSLDVGGGEVTSLFADGTGRNNDPQLEHLSEIVDELNERFGLKLDDRDQLLFDQFEQGWIDDGDVLAQARSNTIENFRLAFDRRFMDTAIERMDENETIFKRILDDLEFQQVLKDFYAERVYRKARGSD